MSDYAMLSLFFSFFLTAFVLSVVLALTEVTTQRNATQTRKIKNHGDR